MTRPEDDAPRPLTDDGVEGLRYIADSPAPEHGGFHPNAVEAARCALATIADLRARLSERDEYDKTLDAERAGWSARLAEAEAASVRLSTGRRARVMRELRVALAQSEEREREREQFAIACAATVAAEWPVSRSFTREDFVAQVRELLAAHEAREADARERSGGCSCGADGLALTHKTDCPAGALESRLFDAAYDLREHLAPSAPGGEPGEGVKG